MSFARASFAAIVISFAVAALPVSAAEFRAFDRATFTAAQAAGKPILIDVHAWWCPVCASQAATIKTAAAAPAYDQLVVFRIDYDKQKVDWRSFGATQQATLIAFKGSRETGRIAYDTDKAKIGAVLASTLG
jgi:thioredoxin 1